MTPVVNIISSHLLCVLKKCEYFCRHQVHAFDVELRCSPWGGCVVISTQIQYTCMLGNFSP